MDFVRSVQVSVPRADLERADDINSAIRISVIEAGGNPEIGEITWWLTADGKFYHITWRDA